MIKSELADEWERSAEQCYAAMYDARPHQVKDCWDDARHHFVRAIEAAREDGGLAQADRLERRLRHVEAVYESQFRGVGS